MCQPVQRLAPQRHMLPSMKKAELNANYRVRGQLSSMV